MTVRSSLENGFPLMTRVPLVAATRNSDKLALLTRMAGQRHELRPLSVADEADEPAVGERIGSDPLVENATAKAMFVSAALAGARTIASDGGLLVPGLGNDWQPARTRRFAGPGATNRERAEALLRLAAELTGDQRQIGWREAVAIAEAGRLIATFTAEASPGWLGESLSAGWDDDGQKFWVPRLWLSNRGDPRVSPGADTDHWDRLALLVAPFLDGLAMRPAL